MTSQNVYTSPKGCVKHGIVQVEASVGLSHVSQACKQPSDAAIDGRTRPNRNAIVTSIRMTVSSRETELEALDANKRVSAPIRLATK